MEAQATAGPSWLDLLGQLWPFLVALAALLWAVIELRVSRMIEKSTLAIKFDLRTEFQKPIGEIGQDALTAETLGHDNKERIVKLETKMDIYLDELERGAARVLRHPGKE
jgi:hypothetical protein